MGIFADSYKWLEDLERREFRRQLYKVTMTDSCPFGVPTVRFWQPKNFLGKIHSWWKSRGQEK